MSNVDLYRAENCLDVVDSFYSHQEHANFLIGEIKKGNIVFYKNANIGDGIFRVIGFSAYASSVAVHGCEYGSFEDVMSGEWRTDANFKNYCFDELFEDADNVEFAIVGTCSKKPTTTVTLNDEQWEAISSAVEDYCLRLCADGERDYLAVMQDAQNALIDELGTGA